MINHWHLKVNTVRVNHNTFDSSIKRGKMVYLKNVEVGPGLKPALIIVTVNQDLKAWAITALEGGFIYIHL